jgi:hypothetical protein
MAFPLSISIRNVSLDRFATTFGETSKKWRI